LRELRSINYWRNLAGVFFDSQEGRANIVLEGNVKLSKEKIDEYGNNFEKVKNGFVDFLLLDDSKTTSYAHDAL
jgi:hypothetical protein